MTALIKAEAVDRLHWLTVPQFADILATIQLAPGAVALTSITFLGYVVGVFPERCWLVWHWHCRLLL